MNPNDILKELEGLLKPEQVNKLRNKHNICTELQHTLDKFITQDHKMIEMKRRISILNPIEEPVLILGETGTGKELIARALHVGKTGKFVPVNCTALPSELIESELFGHEKGSFSGAFQTRIGKFEEASGGTIFLDEIGDMPLTMQTKLLRVLQEKQFCRIGGNEELTAQCRVVCATNKDIVDLVEHSMFREDLYYRISTFILKTTPLRERRGDIELISKSLSKGKCIDSINVSGLELKGNVRELQNIIGRYVVLGSIE